MRFEVKSLLNVVSANFVVMCVSTLLTLVLPNLLGPTEYGYWSFYLLCLSYTGFVIFGFCDGFYLKYGGKRYEDLDKKLFSSYYVILSLFLLLVFFLWISGTLMLLPNNRRSIVLICIGVGGLLGCQNGYFTALNQATARFSIYAKGAAIEKIVLLTAAVVFIFLLNVNSIYIIFASLLGKLLTMAYFTFYSKDIVFSKPYFSTQVMLSALDNVRVGYKLTLANIGSMLMIGFGRFVVENRLGIVELGYYSLMFSIAAIFLQLINAVSVVFYPIFSRLSETKSKYLLGNLDQLVINLGVSILILYYPVRYLMEIIFPLYHSAMDCILYLFPIVVSQARMMVVYNTIYKVLRLEKHLMINVIIAIVFCVIVTLGLFSIYPWKETIALATYLSFLFWNAIAVRQYNKIENTKINWISLDVVISGIYIAANLIFGYSQVSFLLTIITILLFLGFKGKQTISLLKEFRAML